MPAEHLPTISIVTPSFQQGHFLAKTLDSVLSQHGDFHLDYMVIDGGSTDGSAEILREYSQKYEAGELTHGAAKLTFRWLSESDNGQSSAINKGFRLVQGEILAWLNSDDVYCDRQTLAAVLAHFTTRPESKFVYGRGYAIDRQGKILREEAYVTRNPVADLPEIDMILQPAAFWRREVYEQIGELNESLHFVFDWEYWLRCREHFKIDFLDRFLAHNRIHETTKTNQGGIARRREIAELLLAKGDFTDRAIRTYLVFRESWWRRWWKRALAPGRNLENKVRMGLKQLFAGKAPNQVAAARQTPPDEQSCPRSLPPQLNLESTLSWTEADVRRLEHTPEAPKLSYSQIGQDAWVIGEAFNHKRGGFFVEIGAADGITLSNTYLLESEFAWQGICIEANPVSFEKLARCRQATCIQTCLDAACGEVEFAARDLFGGIIDDGLDNSRHSLSSSTSFETIRIPTRPLAEVLAEVAAPPVIDYLSLDVEGAEERVLSEFPFHQYRFRCMTIERPKPNLRAILAAEGYIAVKELPGMDTFYVHSSFQEEYHRNTFAYWERYRGATLLKGAA